MKSISHMAIRRLGLRWMAAAALAAVSASAAVAQDYLINEIMRKAERREYEGGFCARTGWFMERSRNDTAGFYENARIGTAKVFQDSFSGKNNYCAYLRVDNIYYEGNRRCLLVRMWSCEFRLSCSSATWRGCWPGPTTDGMLSWK
jgi:hypothetical protein